MFSTYFFRRVKQRHIINSIELLKGHLTPNWDESKNIIEFYATDRIRHNSLVDKSITMLKDWSAQRPDLKILEQLWTELKRIIFQKNPRSLEKSSDIENTWWRICIHPFQSALE